MPERGEFLSQVFLKEGELVHTLLERSSIGKRDVVVEVGPGKGIITDELLKKAGRVIAIEKDDRLYGELLQKYQSTSNLKLYNDDFLRFALPSLPYKVFSNVPFAIESQLVRKFIDSKNDSPLDSYLVMRREVTERLAGIPREGQFSIIHKPWFDLEIFHYFRRGDFQPKPKVESAMLRFKKKERPLIDEEDRRLYELFITRGFGGGRRLRQNLSDLFTSNQLNHLARELGFRVENMPSELTFEHWLGMFKFVSNEMPNIQKQKFISKSRK